MGRFSEREPANTGRASRAPATQSPSPAESACKHATSQAVDPRPQGPAAIAWPLATAATSGLASLDAASCQARPRQSQSGPQEPGNVVWPPGTAEASGDASVFASATEGVLGMSHPSPQEAANSGQSHGRSGSLGGAVPVALSAAGRTRAQGLALQELANSRWRPSSSSLSGDAASNSFAGAATSKVSASQMPPPCEPKHAVASLTAIAAMVDALQTAGCLQPTVLESFSSSVEELALVLDDGTVSEISVAPDTGSNSSNEPRILEAHGPLLVLWKPPGWTVAVGAGPAHVQVRASELGQLRIEKWLQQKAGLGGCPILADAGHQHGLLHRLDRETSGLLCCAVTYRGYYQALLQFAARRVRKGYVCLCEGHVDLSPRFIDAPLRTSAVSGAASTGTLLQSVVSLRGRPARTEVRQVAHLQASAQNGLEPIPYSFVEVLLHTGRTHQIRAHLAHEGHPLAGDLAYGAAKQTSGPWIPRVFLHASLLSLQTPSHGLLSVSSPLPDDLHLVLQELTAADGESEQMLRRWRR
ncbi:unnamed protein product [Polarella glacialis]|uniref:Pseudouridine synthase RsuA/RluA-like domain-containing protein n=1 Tax=Polarella glacialis TaxID=89957 RepID=A0A813FBR6_POLGL|nr:unnamed protein product [Polarella glacialis]CAE8739513.1 unnamed protein product [Polarella glacialis]